ncbi:hypothetical protein LOD99_15698 [Oopsacas minuta]|uniref:Uncharacterized protein n=1 Tax=Oopsacas minuta TaxID=111878 RepID=A0AAV7K9H2_9METZ|nr:hypothetical protein LOD99_15698 [Oopsacas minuta]
MIEALQAGAYDKLPPGDRPHNPLIQQATEVKSYLSDAEGLGERLEEKEREILEVKKSNAIKTQEIRDTNVKIGMVESKLDNLKKEYTETLSTKSEKILVIEHELLESKENFEQTIKAMESDLNNYEIENKQLKRSLEANKRSKISDSYGTPLHDVVRRTSSQVVDDESNMLALHQNKVLKTALNHVTAESAVLKRRLMNEQLRDLKPLVTCSAVPQDEENRSDSEKSLYKQFSRVKREICHLEASPQVVDLTSGLKGIQEYCKSQLDKSIKKSQLNRQCNDLKQKISLLAASQHRGALIETGTSSFVDASYAKSMECRKIGAIHVSSSEGISRNITTKVDADILRKLLFLTF